MFRLRVTSCTRIKFFTIRFEKQGVETARQSCVTISYYGTYSHWQRSLPLWPWYREHYIWSVRTSILWVEVWHVLWFHYSYHSFLSMPCGEFIPISEVRVSTVFIIFIHVHHQRQQLNPWYIVYSLGMRMRRQGFNHRRGNEWSGYVDGSSDWRPRPSRGRNSLKALHWCHECTRGTITHHIWYQRVERWEMRSEGMSRISGWVGKARESREVGVMECKVREAPWPLCASDPYDVG